MKKVAFLLGLLAAGSGSAHARENPYAGFDYLVATFATRDADLEMSAGRLRVGTEFNRYAGIEYQAALGIEDDEAPIVGGSIRTDLKSVTGVYLRGRLPLGEAAAVYAVAGYSWMWLRVDATAFGLSDRTHYDHDVSAGVGVEAGLPGRFFLSAEYMEYVDGLTAVAAGVRLPF